MPSVISERLRNPEALLAHDRQTRVCTGLSISQPGNCGSERNPHLTSDRRSKVVTKIVLEKFQIPCSLPVFSPAPTNLSIPVGCKPDVILTSAQPTDPTTDDATKAARGRSLVSRCHAEAATLPGGQACLDAIERFPRIVRRITDLYREIGSAFPKWNKNYGDPFLGKSSRKAGDSRRACWIYARANDPTSRQRTECRHPAGIDCLAS